MKIVAGLGNPGREYERTPHNAGFRAVDALCASLGGSWKAEPKWKALAARVSDPAAGQLLLLKPQTFMNLSGESLAPILGFYKIPVTDLVVVLDEVNLAPGRIRVRPSGSAGGHNGLKNIISVLGTENFPRIRMGVGAPPRADYETVDWVLSAFHDQDAVDMADAAVRAADAVECYIAEGPEKAMNRYSQKKPKARAASESPA